MANNERDLSADKKADMKRTRVPIHSQRDKFKFRNLRPDKFYYRLIKMTPDRIAQFMEAGYSWVRSDGTTKDIAGVEVPSEELGGIITVRGGSGVTLGLVCLPIETYKMDQKVKQDKITADEQAMRKRLAQMASSETGGYGSVEISTQNQA